MPNSKSAVSGVNTRNKLRFLFAGLDETLFEYSLSSTWEWREGRLFAYELILKYLIANHIHYVFPSYAFSYSPRQASCSVDEAMLKRYVLYSLNIYTKLFVVLHAEQKSLLV